MIYVFYHDNDDDDDTNTYRYDNPEIRRTGPRGQRRGTAPGDDDQHGLRQAAAPPADQGSIDGGGHDGGDAPVLQVHEPTDDPVGDSAEERIGGEPGENPRVRQAGDGRAAAAIQGGQQLYEPGAGEE